ncbi:MAG: diguanylate cyclase domain-containing protein [Methylococcaceae bacterium]
MDIIKQNNILLVQSESSNRKLISSYFARTDYKVSELHLAADIMSQLQTVATDIILLEINLPKLECYSEQINEFAKARHIPIILLCTSEEIDGSDALDWEMANDVIYQPVNPLELLVKIKTHLKTAELKRQLIISEARQAAILHQSPIAIVYTSHNLIVLKTNYQFFLQFGYNESIQTFSKILNHSSTENSAIEKHCLDNIMQHGHVECEFETQHKNGSHCWVYLRGRQIDNGEPEQGLVWTIDDITSRKVTQDQLQLAATVFEVSGEAMLIMDKNGIIENINPAMQKLIGYSKAELRAHPISELFDLTNILQSINAILSLVKQHQQWKGELWLRKKSQHQFPARVTINSNKRSDSSISHFVVVLADISEHKAQEKELKHRANHDPLTGLPNRNEFFVRLNKALAFGKRHQFHIAILYLDLDSFKPINDTLGHGKGDEVLQTVASKLTQCVREIDTVARLGGDEFAIILNGTSKERVAETANRIVSALNIRIDNSLSLSVSIGIAFFPNDEINPLKLLQYADKAMYKAKLQGKHSFCWHNEQS